MERYIKGLDSSSSPQFRVMKTIFLLKGGSGATEQEIVNNLNRLAPPEAGVIPQGPVQSVVSTGLGRLLRSKLVKKGKSDGQTYYHIDVGSTDKKDLTLNDLVEMFG